MVNISIKDQNILRIEDEADHKTYYGSNQGWYSKSWQRMSGCGPSTVTNIIYYLNRTRMDTQCCTNLTKSECLNLMNEIWEYVKPSLGGVSSTGMLCKGARKYLLENKISMKLDFLDIPKKKVLRPNLQQVIMFLVKALENDAPVAFLNLEHGSIHELESWHWVTIISLEYEINTDIAFASILDSGQVKRIDLSAWLQSTKLGGGFVSFK